MDLQCENQEILSKNSPRTYAKQIKQIDPNNCFIQDREMSFNTPPKNKNDLLGVGNNHKNTSQINNIMRHDFIENTSGST